jgi:phage repressor protein C with HTH and peptisase S24 domain
LNFKSKRAFALKIGVSQTSFNDIINGAEPKYSTLLKIMKAEPDINAEWLITGKGEMLKNEGENTTPKKIATLSPGEGIPLYNVETAAGFGNENFNIQESDIEARYLIKELGQASFMLYVRGDSMSPTYNNGDIVAVKTVKEWNYIQWGKPHLVSYTEGLVLKRLYLEGDCVIAVSDNHGYKPTQIALSEISGIAVVIGVVKLENY